MRGKSLTLVFAALAVVSLSASASEDHQNNFITSDSNKTVISLTLDDSADIALKNSPLLESQRQTGLAAKESAESYSKKLLPQIDLGGHAGYAEKVGGVVLPTGQTMNVGTNYSWSIGPAVSWLAFDGGARAQTSESLRMTALSQAQTSESVTRNTLYNSRIAYFSVQLAAEQLKLVNDSLNVAKSQYGDVSERYNVGSASRLDLVAAHQEVMSRERDFDQAQQELAAQIRNLIAVLGLETKGLNASFPLDISLAGVAKKTDSTPLLVNFEQISATIAKMYPKTEGSDDIKEHPALKSAVANREATLHAYKSASVGYLPKFMLEGKATFEYPNMGELDVIQQNSAGVALSMPIFDWGMILKQARSEKHKNLAAAEQARNTEINLSKELNQTRDAITIIERARKTNEQLVKDAVESAKLMYESYLDGHVIFLDVQRANLNALQAKVESARTDTSLLAQLAKLESFINNRGNDGEPERKTEE